MHLYQFLDDIAVADLAFKAEGDSVEELFRAATEALLETWTEPNDFLRSVADQIPAGCFSGPPLPAETPSDFRKLRRTQDGAEPPAAPSSYLMDMEKAMAPQVPASAQRRDRKGLKIDPKRRKRGIWVREKPPWKE